MKRFSKLGIILLEGGIIMINEQIKAMLFDKKEDLITPVNNVSMVFADNTLLHAIMILNNISYASIPVLDYENKLMGTISTGQIFKYLGERINEGFEVLEKFQVKDAMNFNYYTVPENFDPEDVLRALINHNFLCIVDENKVLKGLITRRAVFKRVNYLAHDFDKRYYIRPKKAKFLANDLEGLTLLTKF